MLQDVLPFYKLEPLSSYGLPKHKESKKWDIHEAKAVNELSFKLLVILLNHPPAEAPPGISDDISFTLFELLATTQTSDLKVLRKMAALLCSALINPDTASFEPFLKAVASVAAVSSLTGESNGLSFVSLSHGLSHVSGLLGSESRFVKIYSQMDIIFKLGHFKGSRGKRTNVLLSPDCVEGRITYFSPEAYPLRSRQVQSP
jgi:hypothetical protein